MCFASVGAVAAFVLATGVVRVAPPATVWVETWRMFGFLVFAGLFAVLALRPRASAGVWEVVIFHKLALAVSAFFLSEASEAVASGMVDAVLVLLLGSAYLLTRGWRSWRLG